MVNLSQSMPNVSAIILFQCDGHYLPSIHKAAKILIYTEGKPIKSTNQFQKLI
jgi:hypothetical protein